MVLHRIPALGINQNQDSGVVMISRNIWCTNYSRCLDRVALKNDQNFSCQGCPMAKDAGGKPSSTADAREDALNCVELLIAIFNPAEYHRRLKAIIRFNKK